MKLFLLSSKKQQSAIFLLLIHRFSQSSHSGDHSDRELSFINCGRSLVDTSITFLKLVLVQLHTCMQIISFGGDSTLPCKASSSEVQPTSYVSSNILAEQITTEYRRASQPVFTLSKEERQSMHTHTLPLGQQKQLCVGPGLFYTFIHTPVYLHKML